MSAASSPSRKRRRVLALLTAAFGVIPSAAGFGLSSVGPQGGLTRGVVAVSDGALVTARSTSAATALETRRWRGGRQGRRRRRLLHEVTCKVASPRRYGSSDWWTNIQNLPKSRLLYNIKEHLFYNTAFAFAVSMVHFLTPQHVIDDLHVSAIPHSIMSGALGLLLVFRTNAAYNRFWEARKVWGNLINQCRNIARLSAVALGPDSVEWKEMKEYIRMFPFLLKQHLQDTRADEELDWVSLPDGEVARIQDDPNPPLFACQIMSEILARAYSDGGTGQSEGGRVPDYTSVMYRMEIEQGLSSLIDGLGKCERILTTPVPRGYSRHTSRFLTVYGFTLPIVLVPHTELFTAPVVAAVCWGLFSIEEIAYFIEQPFDPEYRQLDLMAYSEKVARDIERMTASSTLGRLGSSPLPHLPGSGVGEGLLLSSYRQQLEDLGLPVVQTDPSASIDGNGHVQFNTNGFGDSSHHQRRGQKSGIEINRGDAGGGGDVFDPEDEAERFASGRSKVDKLSKSWSGGPDDDIVGG